MRARSSRRCLPASARTRVALLSGGHLSFPRATTAGLKPVAAKILALIPRADLPALQINNFYNRTGGGKYNNYLSPVKIDHAFSEKHKISVLYSDQYVPQVIAGKGWGVDSPLE